MKTSEFDIFDPFFVQQMVPWWRWFYYINPISWTLYAIIVTQLGDNSHRVNMPSLHWLLHIDGALNPLMTLPFPTRALCDWPLVFVPR